MKPMMRLNSIPAPTIPLDKIGVERWQYDLWYKIIRAALDGHPDQVDLSYHNALKQPAVSRYGATTPALLKWFEAFNRGREYPDQVKPFNFLNASMPGRNSSCRTRAMGEAEAGRPRKQLDLKPVCGVQSEYPRRQQRLHLIARPASQSPPSI